MNRSAHAGFHDGELAVQARAGVSEDAARLTRMVAAPDLGKGAGRALAGMTFAVLTGRDADERRWASPLTGPPGFLAADGPASLGVLVLPRPGDPLAGLPAGQDVGLIAVDFPSARRIRVNGVLTAAGPGGLHLEARQAFGNCPAHISPHSVAGIGRAPEPRGDTGLRPGAVRLIEAADTFFLGTADPESGADVSHKGGPPGFVRVDVAGLWWPDYPGNNMFNSFGNLLHDPAAALLFVDFATGATLQLSGTAVVEWSAPVGTGDSGRRVRFTIERVVQL